MRMHVTDSRLPSPRLAFFLASSEKRYLTSTLRQKRSWCLFHTPSIYSSSSILRQPRTGKPVLDAVHYIQQAPCVNDEQQGPCSSRGLQTPTTILPRTRGRRP